MTNSDICGICAMGFYLPEKQVPLKELAQKAGIPEFVAEYAGARTVREAGPDEMPTDMAIRAARAALKNGDIDPASIDLIIYCGAGLPDYIMPSSAGRVQDAIGAKNAFGFDVVHGCCAMLTALEVAKAQIALNEGVKTVMLAAGDRWSGFTHHHSADSVFFGDGGGAVILKKDHPDLCPLRVEILTQGQFFDLWQIPAGGLRQPASQQTLDQGMHTYICADTERARHEFKEIYIPTMLGALNRVLGKCRLTPRQIDYFDMVNANLKVQEIVMKKMGLEPGKSSAEYLKRYGHFGGQDIFFNLDCAIGDQKVKKGDYILMLTTGIGFSWGAAVMQY